MCSGSQIGGVTSVVYDIGQQVVTAVLCSFGLEGVMIGLEWLLC